MASRKRPGRTSKKDERKELLKEEDAFIDAANQSIAWVDKNKKAVIAGTLGLSLAIALGWGGLQAKDGQAQENSRELSAALAILDADLVSEGIPANPTGTPPTFESDEARLEGTLAALQAVAASSGAGQLAKFYSADVLVKLGKKDEAKAALRALAGELSQSDSLYFLAVERLAYLLEETGAAEEAIKEFERLSAPGGTFYRDQAQYQIARIHQAQGRTEKARAILTGFKTSFPNSTLISDVEERLGEMGELATAEEK